MSMLSKIRFASVATAAAASFIPFSADAKPWELRDVNDTGSTVTTTFVWTFDNHEFKTSEVHTSAPGELQIYHPAKGDVSIGGTVVTRYPNDWHEHEVFTNGDIVNFSGRVPPEGTSDDVGSLIDKLPGHSSTLLPAPALHGGEIFTGVDLSQYLLHPLATIPSFVTFVDGLSSALPGYLVGLSPVTVDPATGTYVTSAPFTGSVSFNSVVTLLAVPEPPTWLLFAIGLTAMGNWIRFRRD